MFARRVELVAGPLDGLTHDLPRWPRRRPASLVAWTSAGLAWEILPDDAPILSGRYTCYAPTGRATASGLPEWRAERAIRAVIDDGRLGPAAVGGKGAGDADACEGI
jgi:hypothetical protein